MMLIIAFDYLDVRHMKWDYSHELYYHSCLNTFCQEPLILVRMSHLVMPIDDKVSSIWLFQSIQGRQQYPSRRNILLKSIASPLYLEMFSVTYKCFQNSPFYYTILLLTVLALSSSIL